MNIDLSDGKINEIVSAAILQEITQESKEILIKEALEYLLQEQTRGDNWNSKKFTPIADIFNNAVVDYARIEIRKMLEEDGEFKDKVKELIKKTLNNVMDLKQSELADLFTSSFDKVLKDSSY